MLYAVREPPESAATFRKEGKNEKQVGAQRCHEFKCSLGRREAGCSVDMLACWLARLVREAMQLSFDTKSARPSLPRVAEAIYILAPLPAVLLRSPR